MAKVTGRSPYEVDEAFVFEQIEDIDDEDRELLRLFISQSQEAASHDVESEKSASEETGNTDGDSISDDVDGVVVKNAYFRICDVPSRQLDDSPIQDIEHPERISSRRGTVFGHKGKFVNTDGKGRRTKLTKVYKRDDNRGVLLNALRRMKFN